MQGRTRHHGIALIALGFSFIILAATTVILKNASTHAIVLAADDSDGDGIDDDIEALNRRSLEVQPSSNEVQIKSESRSGDVQDKIEVQFGKESGSVEISLSYHSDSATMESQLQFKLSFDRIIEYNDTDGNGIYNASIDDLVQDHSLDSFGDFGYSQQVLEGNVTVHHVIAATAGNLFSIDAWFGDGFFTINQSLVTPTQFKIDTRIHGFPFASASSRLALAMAMEYESEVSNEDETEDELYGFDQDEDSIQTGVTPGNISGYFSWKGQALVDGVQTDVQSSAVLHGTEPVHLIYLNYPRGNLVIHDPKVGFAGVIKIPGRGDTLGLVITIVTVALIGVLAVFGLMMTNSEYRNYLLTRTVFVNKGAHRMTMQDVLDNETRNKILDSIISQPGIHFKELLRLIDTTASNLAWHLDVLETYKIIHKQRVGHFLIYYPYLDKNPFVNLNPKIAKSKMTLDIFQLVSDNPGMYQNEIARRMGVDHKTAKYHLDKLMDAVLVIAKSEGRRTRFYHAGFSAGKKDENGAV